MPCIKGISHKIGQPPEEQVTTDEFTKKTTEITKSVDGMKETITKVENNQNGFDKRVATVEKMQLLLNKMSLPYKIHRQKTITRGESWMGKHCESTAR